MPAPVWGFSVGWVGGRSAHKKARFSGHQPLAHVRALNQPNAPTAKARLLVGWVGGRRVL